MAHAQSSPRGLFAKSRVDVATQQLTDDGTNLVLSGGIKISNKQGLTANSTGLVFANPVSALPSSVDNGVLIGLGTDSTGVFAFINSTGGTHKYLRATSVRTDAS